MKEVELDIIDPTRRMNFIYGDTISNMKNLEDIGVKNRRLSDIDDAI